MIIDGRATAVTFVLERLLRHLEGKGVTTPGETRTMLDEILSELDGLLKRGSMAPGAVADARATINALYLPEDHPAAQAA